MNEVKTWLLEMTAASELRKSATLTGDCRLSRLQSGAAPCARQLYTQIGASFAWHDRTNWSDLAWSAHLARPGIGLYLLERTPESLEQGPEKPQRRAEPLGFFELEQGSHGKVLLAYLGLVSRARGVGLGGYLLTRAVETAWQWRATRSVWLRTSSLDSPRALPNYLARGFRIASSASF